MRDGRGVRGAEERRRQVVPPAGPARPHGGPDGAPGGVDALDGLRVVEHGDSRWILDPAGGRFARLPRGGADRSPLTLPWTRCARIAWAGDGSVVIQLDAAGRSRIRLDAVDEPPVALDVAR